MTDLFPEAIETERLRLERLCRDSVDLLEYYRICSADEGIEAVTRYVPWDPHAHPKESAEFVEGREQAWTDGTAAAYVIRPRSPEENAGTFAGQTGLGIDWDRRLGTLGMWLRKRFWGRGYSGERAAALLELAFARLDLEVVSVGHDVDNDKSGRAIEKYVDRFGGRREGTLRNSIVHGEEVADEVRYSVSREEWAASRPDDLHVEFYEDLESAGDRAGVEDVGRPGDDA